MTTTNTITIFNSPFENRSFVKFLINREYIKKVVSGFVFGEKKYYTDDTIPKENCKYCQIVSGERQKLCFKHSVIEDLKNPEKITEITNFINFDFTQIEKNKIFNVFNRFFKDFSKFLEGEFEAEEGGAADLEDIFDYMLEYNLMDIGIKTYILNRNLVVDVGKEDLIVFVSNPDILRRNFENSMKFVEKLSVFVVKKPQIIKSSKTIDYDTLEITNKSFCFDFSEDEIFIAEKSKQYSWNYRVEKKVI